MFVFVCMWCACVGACVHACVRACMVRACVGITWFIKFCTICFIIFTDTKYVLTMTVQNLNFNYIIIITV